MQHSDTSSQLAWCTKCNRQFFKRVRIIILVQIINKRADGESAQVRSEVGYEQVGNRGVRKKISIERSVERGESKAKVEKFFERHTEIWNDIFKPILSRKHYPIVSERNWSSNTAEEEAEETLERYFKIQRKKLHLLNFCKTIAWSSFIKKEPAKGWHIHKISIQKKSITSDEHRIKQRNCRVVFEVIWTVYYFRLRKAEIKKIIYLIAQSWCEVNNGWVLNHGVWENYFNRQIKKRKSYTKTINVLE